MPDPVVRAFSLRSYKAYMHGARYVSVDQHEAGQLVLTPWRNEGRWFGPSQNKDQVLGEYTDAMLGAAVRELVEQAE